LKPLFVTRQVKSGLVDWKALVHAPGHEPTPVQIISYPSKNRRASSAVLHLNTAKLAYANTYPKRREMACFHCQQAAEKALKGYLQYKDQAPPHIHDLTLLCQRCMQLDSSFETLTEAALVLTPYGVASRCPAESSIDEPMTQTAIKAAQSIYDFALAKVPDLQIDQ
jgi:HEPN domain-containing protein